ncbi:MAG: PEP-CTERM sorting domain-containing protein [Candidatus Schekmanbacteria bacterium]|nr:MAG: PEP-CTERM sorting domain-containing protein [Candidatus Schekmanbacteria bacterium]
MIKNKRNLKIAMSLLIFFVSICICSSSQALTISWVDWTSQDYYTWGEVDGNVNGVSVTYTGYFQNAQTGGGINFWSYNPTTYTAPPVVDNPPPDSDMIRPSTYSSLVIHTVTFSQPVVDPVIAIMALGDNTHSTWFQFDRGFDLLNVGSGYTGPGQLWKSGLRLIGKNGSGLIQFPGIVSSVSWRTSKDYSFDPIFQVGISDLANPPVPEPSSFILLAVGISSILTYRNFKK